MNHVAFLTSIIKGLKGSDLWIGLNSIGIHSQYHWTDETALGYTRWWEGAPDNILPIDDPVSHPSRFPTDQAPTLNTLLLLSGDWFF